MSERKRTRKQIGGNFFQAPRPATKQAWQNVWGKMTGGGAGVQHGEGFFGDVWSGIKSAGNWVKDNKLISKGLRFVPGVGGIVGSVAAGQLGLGKRRAGTRVRNGSVRF